MSVTEAVTYLLDMTITGRVLLCWSVVIGFIILLVIDIENCRQGRKGNQ